MPRYVWKCAECGEEIEETRSVADRDAPCRCPRCGRTRTERVIALVSPSFPGADRWR